MKLNGTRRERGAYFTPQPLAGLLAEWGIRSPADRVVDPAAGDGSLVGAAVGRLRSLQCVQPGVTGVELHRRTHHRLVALAESAGIPEREMLQGDFFSLWGKLGQFDVVLANPPYVRHHDIPTKAGARMRRVVSELGYDLSGRASSWAYFVLTAIRMLNPGGRLGAILPSELVNADYGRRVLHTLQRAFGSVQVLRCDGRPFDALQLTTLAVLADDYSGSTNGRVATVQVASVDASAPTVEVPSFKQSQALVDGNRVAAVIAGAAKAEDWRVFDEARSLGVRTLGEYATIRIGYVSGDSQFFHLSESERLQLEIGEEHVRRLVPRGSLLGGTVFGSSDWEELRQGEGACWLLSPQRYGDPAVRRYLRKGVRDGVSERQKCRVRRPWWRVPVGEAPGAVMVFMGRNPRIVAVSDEAWASNSLYTLAVKERVEAYELAVASMTSVFQLAGALRARRLGGGLAKLEVKDAVGLPTPVAPVGHRVASRVDRLVRKGQWEEAVAMADKVVLERGLGVASSKTSAWRQRLLDL